MPEMLGDEPNLFMKDRIEYRGQVFTPTRVNPRGAIGYDFAVVTVDCTEVNSEELVNDPQFVRFARPTDDVYRS
jgi:lipopolysaccharide export system protein LptC